MKLRRKIHRKPGNIVGRYRRRVQSKLTGDDPRKPWRYVDFALKLLPTFGKLRGLWRCHYIFSEILQTSESASVDEVQAMIVQASKCLHQVALDRGSWDTAQLLLPTANPLQLDEFGGDPEELDVIHKYNSAMSDLKKRHTDNNKDKKNHFEEEDDDSDETKKKREAKAAFNKKKKDEASARRAEAAKKGPP